MCVNIIQKQGLQVAQLGRFTLVQEGTFSLLIYGSMDPFCSAYPKKFIKFNSRFGRLANKNFTNPGFLEIIFKSNKITHTDPSTKQKLFFFLKFLSVFKVAEILRKFNHTLP